MDQMSLRTKNCPVGVEVRYNCNIETPRTYIRGLGVWVRSSSCRAAGVIGRALAKDVPV